MDARKDLLQLTEESQLGRMLELWHDIFDNGGLLFSSKEECYGVWVGHLSFATSIIFRNQPHFLISDPEISAYKVLTFHQMIHLCLDQTIACALVKK